MENSAKGLWALIILLLLVGTLTFVYGKGSLWGKTGDSPASQPVDQPIDVNNTLKTSVIVLPGN